MTLFNFFRQTNPMDSFLPRQTACNFWPLSPFALTAMFHQLEASTCRSKLQISGVQPGCSVLVCDQNQHCQWLTMAHPGQISRTNNDVALLSPLGLRLIGKNIGDVATLNVGRQSRQLTVCEIVRMQRQPKHKTGL